MIILLIQLIEIYRKYLPEIENYQKQYKPFLDYIKDCQNHKNYNRKKIINKTPYISLCIPAYNMEKYIETTLLSKINQSFQDFDIIIVNDNSNDDTINILKKMKLDDDRIKIIEHQNNKGVYYSRVETILNSTSEYIILMDPDDMYLNPELFQELYNYNLNNNLDIIEFTVFNRREGENKIDFLFIIL